MEQNSIGVFDSGVGGLTVLKSLIKTLKNENFIYFGDVARLPYGTKSEQTIKRYGFQDAKFLIEKNVKLIVVACNTVSSVALDYLKTIFNIPIIGVIEPAAEIAVEKTKKSIGVIGTVATIKSGKYLELIKNYAKNRGKTIEIHQQATSLLVPFIEDGWKESKILKDVIIEYFKIDDFINKIDTLVLGCTHYPVIQDLIEDICQNKVFVLNSADAVSIKVKEILEKLHIESKEKNKKQKIEIYVTDVNDTVYYLTNKILSDVLDDNEIHKKIKLVDIPD
ncbi:MAG: glutamate racemase [Spirochaetales bacterium]|nr:glutamate racemase [Spirochaetales bacterium]